MGPVSFTPISERSGRFPNCPGGGWNFKKKKKKVTACVLKLHTGAGKVASMCLDERGVERRGKTGKKLVATRLNNDVGSAWSYRIRRYRAKTLQKRRVGENLTFFSSSFLTCQSITLLHLCPWHSPGLTLDISSC